MARLFQPISGDCFDGYSSIQPTVFIPLLKDSSWMVRDQSPSSNIILKLVYISYVLLLLKGKVLSFQCPIIYSLNVSDSFSFSFDIISDFLSIKAGKLCQIFDLKCPFKICCLVLLNPAYRCAIQVSFNISLRYIIIQNLQVSFIL